MALMLVLTTLDRGGSRRELAKRDCSAQRLVSGGQEVRGSRQGGKGSRPLGIGVDSAKGFRGEMRSDEE